MTLLPYRPYPLLRSGHLQTLLVGVHVGHCPDYNARSFLLPTVDGEALAVHEELGGPIAADAPLVILVHGLGGDHRSTYLERVAPQLRRIGFQVWRIDLRGCGAGLEHAWRPANAGLSHDLAAVVKHAKTTRPERRVHIVGFSLSGNILLKMLGEAATGAGRVKLDPDWVTSALAIAPPIDLHACADNIGRFSRRIYNKFYLRNLDQQVRMRRSRWPQWQRVPAEPAVRSIRQFDARYTAPLSGFANADHYYTESSALPVMPAVVTPTTILVDKDDPIVPLKSVLSASFNSESTQLLQTRYGGHMGYFGRDHSGKLVRWMEHFVLEHLKQAL